PVRHPAERTAGNGCRRRGSETQRSPPIPRGGARHAGLAFPCTTPEVRVGTVNDCPPKGLLMRRAVSPLRALLAVLLTGALVTLTGCTTTGDESADSGGADRERTRPNSSHGKRPHAV